MLLIRTGVFGEDHADSGRYFRIKSIGGEQASFLQARNLQPPTTQVADLNSLLKSKLNISDAPVMMAGAAAPAPAAAAPVEVPQLLVSDMRIMPWEVGADPGNGALKLVHISPQEEEEAAPQVIQTSFTVKLNKFDASKKVVDYL